MIHPYHAAEIAKAGQALALLHAVNQGMPISRWHGHSAMLLMAVSCSYPSREETLCRVPWRGRSHGGGHQQS